MWIPYVLIISLWLVLEILIYNGFFDFLDKKSINYAILIITAGVGLFGSFAIIYKGSTAGPEESTEGMIFIITGIILLAITISMIISEKKRIDNHNQNKMQESIYYNDWKKYHKHYTKQQIEENRKGFNFGLLGGILASIAVIGILSILFYKIF